VATAPRLGRRGRLVLAAVIVLAAAAFVAYAIDLGRILSVLSRADRPLVAVALTLALAGIACWSEAIRSLLPPEGASVTRRRGFLVYATGSMVRNVVPVGYASSIGVLSFVYRREASLSFHRSLAAVSVAELLVAMASMGVAVIGIALFGLQGPAPPLVRWLGIGVTVLAIGATLAGAVAWHRRTAVERLARVAAGLFARVLGRLTPGLGGRLTPAAIEHSLGEYAVALSRVSARRRTLVGALALAFAGWGALVGSLYVSGLAVGFRLPLAVALLVVPIAGYATVLPVPGGLGGYELGVAGVLHYLGGLDPAAALAVTLLFRICSFWAVIAVGAVASAALSVDVRGLAGTAMERGEPSPSGESGDGASDDG